MQEPFSPQPAPEQPASEQPAPSPATQPVTQVSERLALQRLLDELMKLPGIGAKSAQRIAYYILSGQTEAAHKLAQAIVEVKDQIHFCARCFSYSTQEYCAICQDASRDQTTICVVAEPRDVEAIERTRSYHGLYHVLGGLISPANQIAPKDLRIDELLTRINHEATREVLIATNFDIDGEVTANFLGQLLQPFPVTTTRLASGMPIGGELEFADEGTLGRAIEERRDLIK